MWIILSVYFLYRWSEKQGWKWTILAGLTGGIAVLTKIPAAYIVGGAAVAMVLYTLGIKRFWRNPQVWAMVILMVLPTVIFYVSRQGRASEYFASWTISLSHLLLEPNFYGRWLNLAQSLVGLLALLASLVGVLIAQPRYRIFLIGLWAGYFVYGLFLPYQLYTHSYYHLQLVPIVALSLAPVAQVILDRLAQQGVFWRILFVGILLVGIIFPAWLYILDQSQQDYRSEPAYWQEIASYLPTDGKIIALTQDYGYRLMYYGWRKVALWPNRGDRNLSKLRGREKEFESFFIKNTEGKGYFVITAFNQLESQPDLKKYLVENYPVVANEEGYLIYDLQHPLNDATLSAP
jgi:4-amino-4-deoxy-L-arabinose transferase-like glycosyltransferase